ncbi:transposable element Tcb1 transposase [Trichonephila clavipes]|nr:transposable element Tcb1 transposase [Trichonephila clavipes]
MVWGVIAYNTRSPLILTRGTMTFQWYVHNILPPQVFPLMQRLPGAISQQGNARLLTARVSQDCLRTLTTLSWPDGFPDLSPIEHICDHLGWRVGHPTSLNELEARLQQIWNEMSQDIQKYASMPNRIASGIHGGRGSTGHFGLSFTEMGKRVGRNLVTVLQIWHHPPHCTTATDERRYMRMAVMGRASTSGTI